MNKIVKSRSWATQRLANYFPSWSRARTDEFSLVQQLLHPVGCSLEDMFTQLTRASRNNFLESADISQVDIADYFILPRSFPVSVDNLDEENPRYRAPTGTAKYENYLGISIPVSLSSLEENNLEGFLTADPTGVEITGASVVRLAVLEETAFSALGEAIFSDPPVPTNLYLTIADATDFRSIIGTQFIRGFVKITGISSKEIEESEVIDIAWNRTIRTKIRWKSLTSVEVVSIYPDTATIKIEADSFFLDRHLDDINLFVDDVSERQVYYSVQGTDDARTELLYESYSVLNLGDLEDGHTTYDVNKIIEIRDTANASLEIANIAYDSWTETIYGTDGEFLYFWDLAPLYPSIRGELFSTPGLSNRIYTEQGRFIGLGDDIEFCSRRQRDDKQISAIRWTIYAPNGTKYYLDLADTMQVWSNPRTGWIYAGHTTENLWNLKFHPEFNQRGVSFVVLETMYAEQLYEKDVYPVIVESLVARKQLFLPEELLGSTRVSFDANGTLWFYDAGLMTPARLRHDVFLMDYSRKVAYFRERYTEVTLEPHE